MITGSLQTLGWVTDQKNRNFLAICENRRWLDLQIDEERGPSEWLAAVEDYVDDERHHADTIRYFYWLRSYIGIDTMTRHITKYTTAFLDIHKFKGRFSPKDVLTLRNSQKYDRGGPSAPPMLPFLGVGACFVFRELVRSHNESDPTIASKLTGVYPYCYMPVKRLRGRLHRLGWQSVTEKKAAERSRSIHGFLREHLSDPTFGGDFDIPLLTWPDWDAVRSQKRSSADGDFITLSDGRPVPRR